MCVKCWEEAEVFRQPLNPASIFEFHVLAFLLTLTFPLPRHTHTHGHLLTHKSLCFLIVYMRWCLTVCVLLTVVKCLAAGGELLQLFRDLCHQRWESRSGKPTFLSSSFPLLSLPYHQGSYLIIICVWMFVWLFEVSTRWCSVFLDILFPTQHGTKS